MKVALVSLASSASTLFRLISPLFLELTPLFDGLAGEAIARAEPEVWNLAILLASR
jgi:hypothetical protein